MLNTNYARAEEVNQKIEEAKRGKMELSFFGSRVIPQWRNFCTHDRMWTSRDNNNNKLQIYIAQFLWRDDQLRITTMHGIK